MRAKLVKGGVAYLSTFTTNENLNVMKKMHQLILALVLFTGTLVFSSSTILHKNSMKSVKVKSEVSFTIYNNTDNDFAYYYNGGENYINHSVTKSFSLDEGDELYYYDNGKGNLWLKITSDMNGKDYKLTDLTN